VTMVDEPDFEWSQRDEDSLVKAIKKVELEGEREVSQDCLNYESGEVEKVKFSEIQEEKES